jgi:hypothetical protein
MRPLVEIRWLMLVAIFLGFLAIPASATTYCVDINSANPTPPYTDWSTAATNIQNAVDSASPGDLVLVTNGVYCYSGRVYGGSATNCVVVTNSITVQSVNGPAFTFIEAYPSPFTTNGPQRCVYLGASSVLSGFTLMNGSAASNLGGGIDCANSSSIVSNCVITLNFSGSGGGSCFGSYFNCTVSDNISHGFGGGICDGTIISNCAVIGNSATSSGGGGYLGSYYNCTISDNISSSSGGGIFDATIVSNCAVIGNSAAGSGGGSLGGSYLYCIISNNFCGATGGGVCVQFSGSTLNNCLIVNNYANNAGGIETDNSILINCTIAGNNAQEDGGLYDVTGSILSNCIVYYNFQSKNPIGESDIFNTTNVYSCCTSTTNGLGLNSTNNLIASPGFVNVDGGDFHLAEWSPCIDAGNNDAVTSTMDLDGNPRIVNGTVDIGAYEYQYPPFTNVVHFVVLKNTNAVPPYTNWENAASNIQEAIDVSSASDFIVVSNNTYSTGGRVVSGSEMNRVVVDVPVTVQSLSGAALTLIQGSSSQVRCAYVTNGATMIGFTFTNGDADTGASTTDDSGGGAWCESTAATIMSCTFVNDQALNFGGGAYSGTLIGCILNTNRANYSGGGSCAATLINCVLSNNIAVANGGGACLGVLTNCLLLGNRAFSGGGGTCSNTLYNCTLSGNWSLQVGGAAYLSVLNSCTLLGNLATNSGGGAYTCILTNCILSGSWAPNGGGATYGLLVNCILTNNVAINGGGSASNTLYNCLVVTNRAANNGGGCFYAVLTNCIFSSNLATNYGGGDYGGTLNNCFISGNSAQAAGGGACLAILSNCIMTNNWAGRYGGGGASNTLNNCMVVSNISGLDGGGVMCGVQNNCLIYGNVAASGGGGSDLGTLNNCSLFNNFVSGTYIPSAGGGGAFGSIVIGCVVSNNISTHNGGGAVDAVLTNCLIVDNSATGLEPPGGGTYDCYLNNCTVMYNTNSGVVGHGATNSIIYNNTVTNFSLTYAEFGINLRNCCTYGTLPSSGSYGNITNVPLFVNAGSDFHLQSNSPCINAGNNAFVSIATDFDGNPRIQGGTVDMGAYEYQTPTSVISYAWLQQYGLPSDGSVDFADLDGTAFDVYQDWVAGLNPTNPASILAMLPPAPTNSASGVTVSWQSVTNIPYLLQRSTNLSIQPPFSTIQSNITGQAGTTSYTDTSAMNDIPYFYRVGVQVP